jgi:hypothetical protein
MNGCSCFDRLSTNGHDGLGANGHDGLGANGHDGLGTNRRALVRRTERMLR